ncbi:helix-turn-helix domain-containing protein [Streptomyces sp. NPDC056194]|uniref:helix-turn-helix domain-containing protein n=1 Tax=Streptomyces sp. NPDC056194 TaxID=3345744 RepID=UPI0035DC565B
MREQRGASLRLGEGERIHIADRLREKASIRTIAAELSRSPSTISREIQRNRTVLHGYNNRWYYRPHAAQRRADARRPSPKTGKIAGNTRLRDYIQERLERPAPRSVDWPAGGLDGTGVRCGWRLRFSPDSPQPPWSLEKARSGALLKAG